MAVSQHVIDGYLLLYSKSDLEGALRQALSDRAAGVHVTSYHLGDAGGAGQMISGDPNEVIEILTIAIKQANGELTKGPPPLASVVNFSGRRVET
jgi:2-methylcitrate dehydratase PrpD